MSPGLAGGTRVAQKLPQPSVTSQEENLPKNDITRGERGTISDDVTGAAGSNQVFPRPNL